MLAAAAVKSFDLGGNAPYRIIGQPSGPANVCSRLLFLRQMPGLNIWRASLLVQCRNYFCRMIPSIRGLLQARARVVQHVAATAIRKRL